MATSVKSLLEARGYSVLILDGDDVRTRIHIHLGFTEGDIKQNNALIAELCLTCRQDHDVILVPIISPYESSRKQARVLLGDRFFEIYFSVDLETVIRRDVKGLYSKAKRNEITNLIGYSPGHVYEAPRSPDFMVNSESDPVEKSVGEVYEFIMNHLTVSERF